ncbi:hypothetical protein [Paraburkholderia sp. SIMBA_027]|uniref:hypothetical protein n=1 Tax=Paraburkholderia sp. SIMBA_027 TaxID=3085770 RepID=UPI0039782678
MRFNPYDESRPRDEEQTLAPAQTTRERLARERRRRADISMFSLPPFVTPTYSELRRLYVTYRNDPTVRRLILEIQCARYSILELSAMAAECHWDLSKERASIEEARKTFSRLRHRLRKELDRIGQVHGRK